MTMHDIKQPTEDLQDQLNTAKEEIQSLSQQLKSLLILTENAWRGDQSAIIHLAELIGIDPEIEPNAFNIKKPRVFSAAKKTVTIADSDEILSKQTPSFSSLISHENQRQVHTQVAARNTYLQPFLKQNHIDPIREQSSRQIFHNMMRYHQNEVHKPPLIASRVSSATVRPRAIKHLYRPASPDHAVRHLGSPSSRTKPYFVFAGKEFFQQTSDCSPLYEKAFITSNGARHSDHSDISDESDVVASPRAEPVNARPQTAKSTQRSSTRRFSVRSGSSDGPARASSAVSNGLTIKLTPMNERETT